MQKNDKIRGFVGQDVSAYRGCTIIVHEIWREGGGGKDRGLKMERPLLSDKSRLDYGMD